MKLCLLLLVVFFTSCIVKRETDHERIISGNDTIDIYITGSSKMDLSKTHGGHGHYDSANKISILTLITDTVFIHDTANVVSSKFISSYVGVAIKPYLIEYYEQGWRDAANGLIELQNRNRLTDLQVDKRRIYDWNKMSKQIKSIK